MRGSRRAGAKGMQAPKAPGAGAWVGRRPKHASIGDGGIFGTGCISRLWWSRAALWLEPRVAAYFTCRTHPHLPEPGSAKTAAFRLGSPQVASQHV